MEIVPWLFIALGALVWFGGWRSWVDPPGPTRTLALAGPWLGLGFLLLEVGLLLRWVGLVLPSEIVPGLMLVPAVVGVSVGTFGWPHWAKPPWYRRMEALEREVDEREGPSARF